MKNIVIISNLRMIFIYFLLNRYHEGNIFIMGDDVSDLNIEVMVRTKKGKGNIALFFSLLKNYFTFKKILWKNKLDLSKFNVYGADHILGSSFFLKRCPFYLIEDGTENYQLKNYKRSLKNRLFSLPKFGMYKNVKKIYLTKNDNIPDCIKEKVEIIDIHQLWKEKTKVEQDEILFLLDVNVNKIKNLKSKNTVLFTQPLSEDNVLTEQEKIDIYSSIIENYDKEKLVVKTHPREKTNYQGYFPDVEVFNENYPSEILDVLGVKFEKAVTLFSTAVYVYPKENVDFYGTKIHPKLEKRFGEITYE
ncbi:glycosyltransferase family 52 [Rodentibacter caecimuris]|uniref:glycosyltransferase family 52 n=2 Tax=Rodentibacter caecimuris TaxID=1796644 RepID=UPI0007510FB5|nr:glycosyltransferase family 52 [Rodentibacter heylii]